MEFNYYLPKIKRLKIDNFDLYKCPLEIDLSDKLNVIFGTNGLGKTTLLNIIRIGQFWLEGIRIKIKF